MTHGSENKWVIVGKDNCRWCHQAMVMFQAKGIDYTYLNMDRRPDLKQFILDCGLKTAPQIFLNGYLIGGFTETEEYLRTTYDPTFAP